MYSGNDAVSDLSASLQGSLTLPSSNTSGGNNNNNYYYQQQAGNAANNSYYADARYNNGQPQQTGVNPYAQRINQVSPFTSVFNLCVCCLMLLAQRQQNNSVLLLMYNYFFHIFYSRIWKSLPSLPMLPTDLKRKRARLRRRPRKNPSLAKTTETSKATQM